MSSKDIKIKLKVEDLITNKVDELREYKAKQNGEITPRKLLVVLLNELMNEEIEDMMVVRTLKDGTVATGWTSEDGVKALGLAEYLKMHIIDEIQ